MINIIFPVLQEVQLGETGSGSVGVAEDTPTEPDLTAGKKDVFLVDVRDDNLNPLLANVYLCEILQLYHL